MKNVFQKTILFIACLVSSSIAHAEECPVKAKGGVCLDKSQSEMVRAAVKELKDIHTDPVLIEVEPIIIIRDWNNRVYINGQEKKPIKLKLRLGKTIDRDMEMQLPIQLYFRDPPPPPMFRLRVRAQAGILSTPLLKQSFRESLDGGLGWDFFGLWGVNLAMFTGVRSAGPQLGFDITKNFGISGGYGLIYDGFHGTGTVQVYFSFN